MEDRERELQRVEKPRLRTRTQFRPWPEVSRDDAGGPQSARLRLAHRARTARTALAGRSRSGGQANQLLRSNSHYSVYGGFSRNGLVFWVEFRFYDSVGFLNDLIGCVGRACAGLAGEGG